MLKREHARMTFSDCLNYLKNNFPMARRSWIRQGKFIFFVAGFRALPDEFFPVEIFGQGAEIDFKPQILLANANGQVELYSASTNDLVATDWVIMHTDSTKYAD
jgi:hypothetical protein